ncbi:MAG TPA: hypothetical protein V6C78_04455 [Crinalium sp.]
MNTRSIICFVSGGIATVLLSTTAVNAQTNAPTSTPTVTAAVSPFELVYMAYQGFFEREGIPAGNGFTDLYQADRLSAEDLVRTAIQSNRLPSDTLTNHQYLGRVDAQLKALIDLDK